MVTKVMKFSLYQESKEIPRQAIGDQAAHGVLQTPPGTAAKSAFLMAKKLLIPTLSQ